MNIIKPSVEIEHQDWGLLLKRIEKKGRVCYKSEDRITDDSAERFIEFLVKRGHLSVLEHEKISVKFIVDRGITHEIVRHRVGSYSQESTRYCNYGNDDKGITVIEPFFYPKGSFKYDLWMKAERTSEEVYLDLLEQGSTPQEARDVLTNSLKTEIWVTYNIREWLYFFSKRAVKEAHPQMRQPVIPLLMIFKGILPAVFGASEWDRNFPANEWANVTIVD